MADHSLRGYLKRQSTVELDSLLAYYLQEENYANNEYVILEILRILEERFAPDTAPDLTHHAKEMLLEYEPKD